jgi:hypothetical protein
MTTLRPSGRPASSVIGYAVDGDELLVGADENTRKVRCLEHDPRVTLCVFGDEAQPQFATLEGEGAIEREGLARAKRLVLSKTVPRGHAPLQIETWLNRPETLIVRVRATRVWGMLDSVVHRG